MKTYARIDGGLVVELLATAGDIAAMFHPSLVWVDASAAEGVAPGWSYASGSFAAPAAPSLAAVQASRIATLRAACTTAITSGYTSAALGAAHSYPSTPTDQANMAASVVASLLPGIATGWTTPFWCADAGGTWSFAAHTAAQIQLAGSDGKAMVVGAQQKLAGLEAQVTAATTVAAVRALAW
jgi:hypothetical protein